MAGDVADDQCHPRRLEADEIIEIAADLGDTIARHVPGAHLHAGWDVEPLGEHAALKKVGYLVLLVIALLPLKDRGDLCGQLLG